MSSKALMVLVRVALLLLYVWAVREAYTFIYADSCLDVGGAMEATGFCSAPTLAEAPDLGARAPLVFWLVLLTLPAVAVWLLDRSAVFVMQRQSPNTYEAP